MSGPAGELEEKREERHGPLYDGLREFAQKYNLRVPQAPYKPEGGGFMDFVAEDLETRLKSRSRTRVGPESGIKKTAYTPTVAESVPPAAGAGAEPASAPTGPTAVTSQVAPRSSSVKPAARSSSVEPAGVPKPQGRTASKCAQGRAQDGGVIRRGFLNDDREKTLLERWYPRVRDYLEVHLLPAERPSEPNLLLEMIIIPLIATLTTRNLLLLPAQQYLGSKAIYVAYSTLLYLSSKHGNRRIYHGAVALLLATGSCAALGGTDLNPRWVYASLVSVALTWGGLACRPVLHRALDRCCR